MFDVIKVLDDDILKSNNGYTKHVEDRLNRFRFASELGDNYTLVNSYVVNTGHENGLEIHSVYSNGMVVIANQDSRKIVTVLIARPMQLKRYGLFNNELLFTAYQHTTKGYNNL